MSNNKPAKQISQTSALVTGILGILIPVGLQNFIARRTAWGFIHLGSKLLLPAGYFIWLFDGYCAGGKFCSKPPSFLAFIGSFIIALCITTLVLNLVECAKIINKGKIIFKKESSILGIAVLILTLIVFAYRYCLYLS
ncbi:hypothetical protein IKF34_01520 [Candidatus Saccharibacteria bacterium]|nr:hypothetical protein [Candidatus Saccharibacteria bacterium]